MQGSRTDVNAVVGGYLRDLAFAQPSQQKMFGYKRAATAILALEGPLTDLLDADGPLPPVSSSMLRPPSLMPGSPAFRRTSSTAGLSTVCSRGFGIRRESVSFHRQVRRKQRRILAAAAHCSATHSDSEGGTR